jgi:PAS domain S-box-containing protein
VEDPAEAEGDEKHRISVFRGARDDIANRIKSLLNDGYLGAFSLERERLQRFADMMDDGIIIHDEFRNLFLVNRAFLDITGREYDEVIGKDCHEVFSPHGLCGASCKFRDGHDELKPRHEYQVRLISGQGEKKQLKIISEPMEIEPGKLGIMAVVKDETETTELRSKLGERRSFHGMVGVSPAVQEVFDTILSVSVSDYPVLITGESGTGKELVATAIHNESGRKAGPFVPVNCGALPENILESELFGHVRGAFTGAIRDKKGRFELADGGTMFLDEIGELSLPVQVKLLRVLEEQRFERVGGENSISVDVRVISATNRDLRGLVGEGKFREDLFYRLCVVPIVLPPLRERREDFPYLVEHILARIRAESGKPIQGVSNAALDCLLSHSWPGNIRELINALQFASVRCTGEVIWPEHLPPEVRRGTPLAGESPSTQTGDGASVGSVPTPRRGRAKLTSEIVASALEETGGNKVRAAKLLGVGRATLYRFLDDVKQ